MRINIQHSHFSTRGEVCRALLSKFWLEKSVSTYSSQTHWALLPPNWFISNMYTTRSFQFLCFSAFWRPLKRSCSIADIIRQYWTTRPAQRHPRVHIFLSRLETVWCGSALVKEPTTSEAADNNNEAHFPQKQPVAVSAHIKMFVFTWIVAVRKF